MLHTNDHESICRDSALTMIKEYCDRIDDSGEECYAYQVPSNQARIRLTIGPMWVDFIASTWAELYEQLTSIPLY